MMCRYSPTSVRRQRGAALFVSLILLLVLTLIGVTAAQMQTVEERMALNDDSHQLALQSGEAVIRDSEEQFDNGDYSTFPWDGSNGSATLWQEATSGSYSSMADATSDAPAFTGAGAIAYDGPALGSVHVGSAYKAIEDLPTIALPGDALVSAGYPVQISSLRSTSLAGGADAASNAVVQSIRYHPSAN